MISNHVHVNIKKVIKITKKLKYFYDTLTFNTSKNCDIDNRSNSYYNLWRKKVQLSFAINETRRNINRVISYLSTLLKADIKLYIENERKDKQ
jgi:hypothetical protein